jgi:hypothetical protein
VIVLVFAGNKPNPFTVVFEIKQKRSSAKKKDSRSIVDMETGELLTEQSYISKTVNFDAAEFVKVFPAALPKIAKLNSAGIFMLCEVMKEMQQSICSDVVVLFHNDIPKSKYYRGIKELVEHEFIAHTGKSVFYYVNPNLLFNGNRLKIKK